jgi:hypothetical protein
MTGPSRGTIRLQTFRNLFSASSSASACSRVFDLSESCWRGSCARYSDCSTAPMPPCVERRAGRVKGQTARRRRAGVAPGFTVPADTGPVHGLWALTRQATPRNRLRNRHLHIARTADIPARTLAEALTVFYRSIKNDANPVEPTSNATLRPNSHCSQDVYDRHPAPCLFAFSDYGLIFKHLLYNNFSRV